MIEFEPAGHPAGMDRHPGGDRYRTLTRLLAANE
jgi:hypothetical protein